MSRSSFDSELVGLDARDAAGRTLSRPLSTGGIGRLGIVHPPPRIIKKTFTSGESLNSSKKSPKFRVSS